MRISCLLAIFCGCGTMASAQIPASPPAKKQAAALVPTAVQKEIVVKVQSNIDNAAGLRRLTAGIGSTAGRGSTPHTYRVRLRSGLSLQAALTPLRQRSGVVQAQGASARPAELFDSVTLLSHYLHQRKLAQDTGDAKAVPFINPLVAPQGATPSVLFSGVPGERDDALSNLEFRLHELRLRTPENRPLDREAYQRAAHHRNLMPTLTPRTPAYFDGVWEQDLPRQQIASTKLYTGDPPFSGRINGITYDPKDANICYAVAAWGGLWRGVRSTSNPNDITWTCLSDNSDWRFQQASSVTVDPADSRILYVGTGDYDQTSWYGFGIMCSTDGGTNWTNLGYDEMHAYAVRRVVVSPESSQWILAATGRGQTPNDGSIWLSSDGGKTWLPELSNADWSDLIYSDPDPKNNNVRTYYAIGRGTGGLEMWRSDRSGLTWKRVNLPASVSASSRDLACITTSKTDPNTVYVLSGADRKLWRSTVRGDDGTWEELSSAFPNGYTPTQFYSVYPKSVFPQAVFGIEELWYNWKQSDYDCCLACSKRTDALGVANDVLYVGLIDMAVSPDGGYTWQSVGGPTYTYQASTHNDQHTIAVNPAQPDECLIGNDGGVYRVTFDPLKNLWPVQNLNAGLIFSQFRHATFSDKNPGQYLGGLQDNATIYRPEGQDTWYTVGEGDGGAGAINPIDDHFQYTTSQSDIDPQGLHSGFTMYATADAWKNTRKYFIDVQDQRIAWLPPMVIDRANPHFLYLGTNYLWRYNEQEKDVDKRWSQFGTKKLSSKGSLQCIAVSPTDTDRIYTGSEDGELWVSTAAGGVADPINVREKWWQQCAITAIAVHPKKAQDVLVGLGFAPDATHLWRCRDTTVQRPVWVDVSGGKNPNGTPAADALPDTPINCAICDPRDPENVFLVGTDIGVFMTQDGGKHWANITAPLKLPNVQVTELQLLPGGNLLYAATFGRGIWKIHLHP